METITKQYTIRCKHPLRDLYFTIQVDGVPVDLITGYEFILHATPIHDDIPYSDRKFLEARPVTISEVSTGWRITLAKDEASAIEDAMSKLSDIERFTRLMSEALEKNKTLFPNG